MTLKVVIHVAEEGGYWGEVPALPGCATQGETIDELIANVHEAVAGWLDVDEKTIELTATDQVMEMAF